MTSQSHGSLMPNRPECPVNKSIHQDFQTQQVRYSLDIKIINYVYSEMFKKIIACVTGCTVEQRLALQQGGLSLTPGSVPLWVFSGYSASRHPKVMQLG